MPPLRIVAAGQVGGLLSLAALLWIHGGLRGSTLDPLHGPWFWVLVFSWVLMLALSIFWAPRRIEGRPHLPLILALVPALVGAAAGCLILADPPALPDRGAGCELLLTLSCAGERVRCLGLLASGGLLLGSLPLFLWGRAEPPERLARWPLLAAGLAWILVLVAAFLDPGLPERAPVGGWPVHGLWPLAAAPFALWFLARWLPRAFARTGTVQAAVVAGAVGLGLSFLGLGVLFFHRGSGLQEALQTAPIGVDPLLVSVGVGTGNVLATTLRFLVPLLLAAAGLGLLGGLLRGSPRERRSLVLVVCLLLVVAALGLGYQAGFQRFFDDRCSLGLPASIQLPLAHGDSSPAAGCWCGWCRRSCSPLADTHPPPPGTVPERPQLATMKVQQCTGFFPKTIDAVCYNGKGNAAGGIAGHEDGPRAGIASVGR